MRALTHAISTTALFLCAAICLATGLVGSRIAHAEGHGDYLTGNGHALLAAGVLAFAGFLLVLCSGTPASACLGAGFLVSGVLVFSSLTLFESRGEGLLWMSGVFAAFGFLSLLITLSWLFSNDPEGGPRGSRRSNPEAPPPGVEKGPGDESN
jgi:hypothetical protein